MEAGMLQVHIIRAWTEDEQSSAIEEIVEDRGHSVWRNPHAWSLGTYNYDRAIDQAILGCDTVILMWSVAASRSRLVSRQLQLVARLAKPMATLRLDSCPLPAQATKTASFPLATGYSHLLSYIDNYKSDALLQRVVRQLADERVGTRRQGTERLRELAGDKRYRGHTLRLLEFLVDYELNLQLRSLAETILEEQR
jgi:hypothetical protein